MNLDDKVCYCFHVSRRKLVNWVRLNRPRVPSQVSMCSGAGTGCGWCIPFLKQIFTQETAPGCAAGEVELDRLSPAEYEARRAEYVNASKGNVPSGASEPPDGETACTDPT